MQHEQLERARQEQINAAQKLKQLSSLEEAIKEGNATAVESADDSDVVKDGLEPSKSVVESLPTRVWLCLKCGSQACDAKDKDHCLTHYKTPR